MARSRTRGASRSTRNFASAATTHCPLSDLFRRASCEQNASSIAPTPALHYFDTDVAPQHRRKETVRLTMRGTHLTNTILKLDALETRIRRFALRRLERIPALIQYKTLKQIEFLKEVCGHLDRLHAQYCIVGGFAYDGKRGFATRMHKDVDVAFVEEHRNVVVSALSQQGYRIQRWSPFITVAEKGRFNVDLYEWKTRENGFVETMMFDTMVRVPRIFFENTQTVELMGVPYRIASNELLVSALPFVPDESDRKFISSLSASAPIEFRTTTEVITASMEATVHEYAGDQ